MEHHASVKLADLPTLPTYNVKAVCMRTGITGATLRAWERRYGLPSPNRSTRGYRLYSERDVAILYWLIQETEKGVSIGHAAQQLTELLVNGNDLIVTVPVQRNTQDDFAPRSPEVLAAELAEAYGALTEQPCHDLINEALALYTLETVLFSVVRRALTIIHDEIAVQTTAATVENFAFNHVRHQLEHILYSTPLRNPKRSTMLIGFTDEGCELDLLILTILLRRAGQAALYMTANFDAKLLRSEVMSLQAILIMIYVNSAENGRSLSELANGDERSTSSIVYAGGVLTHEAELRDATSFEFLGDDLRDIYHALLARLRRVNAFEPDRS